MDLIQSQPGNGVLEILLVPTGVTAVAHFAQLGDTLAGRMTGPAIQPVVISVQRPAGGVMSKTGTLLDIVTLAALVIDVTVVADGVHFFLGLVGRCRSLEIVTVAAILLAVTVHTPEPEQIDMFLVMKSNDLSRLIRCVINLLDRLGDYRV